MKLVSLLNRFRTIGVFIMFTIINSTEVCDALHVPNAAAAATGAWTWYKSMLVTQPLVTKSLTSSGIMSVSDVMCQEVVSKMNPDKDQPSKLDYTRVLHVAITGSLWSGPITHYWYMVLER